jgi:hypothetical protein
VSSMSRALQGLPPYTLRQRAVKACVCGDALPWVQPKKHSWKTGQGSGGTFHTCQRCTRKIGF